MGCLILECLDAGHRVTLFYDNQSASGTKAYQKVTNEKLQTFERIGAQIIPIESNELDNLGSEFQIDVLVLVEGFHFFRDRLEKLEELRKKGVRVVSLANFFENLRQPLGQLDYFDKTFYLSSFALDTHFSLYGDPSNELIKTNLATRFEISGSPMFDQMLNLKKNEFRDELGIPLGKKVVVLFAPVVSTATDWRNYLWGEKSKLNRLWRILSHRKFKYLSDALSMPTFADIATSIRRFCDRNDAFLIVKSRLKQDNQDVFEDIADLFLSGEKEVYFPVFTSYKILACADLCISAMSMAVLEGVAANVPVVNIYLPPTEYKSSTSEFYPDKTKYLDAIMNIEHESPFSYPGCVTTIDRGKAAAFFDKRGLKEFMVIQEARTAYVERFLGFAADTSSKRILASIEKLLLMRESNINKSEQQS